MCYKGDPEGPYDQEGEEALKPGSGLRNEISGTVHGPAVQARDIHGNVHIHHPFPRLPPPNQLPAMVRLTGRTTDLTAMDAGRASGLIVITGPPGIGKTALAVRWSHGVRGDFPDGVLYEDLHGHAPDGPASPRDVLGRFARSLGMAPQQVPADLAELTAAYRSLMSDRRMLVVLDDALTAAQVAPILPPSPTSLTVVTSRWRLGGLAMRGGRIIQLGKLESDAAIELLISMLGDDRAIAEPRAVRELVDLCARVPLAVCVAGARLAARVRWPIGEMVQALTHEQQRLATLTMEDMAVRSALDVSYRSLDLDAARLYRVMGLYPGAHFSSSVAAAAVARPQPIVKQLLGQLADANLLDDVEGGQYRFHDLTRLHAREMAERDEPGARSEAVHRMLDWFLAAATSAGQSVTPYRADQPRDIQYPPTEPARFPDATSALNWLDHQLPQVMAAMRLAVENQLPTLAWQLADAMWPLFLYRGHYAERLEFDRLGLDAAEQSGDRLGKAKMLNRVGLALMDLRRADEADTYFRRALDAWRELGNDRRVAGSLRRLGLLAATRGHPAEAIQWFTQALELYRRLGADRNVALTLSDLAGQVVADQPNEAITMLEEAASLLEEVPDRYNRARVFTRLGQAHDQTGEFATAGEHLRRALRLMRDIGSPRGEAETLLALGQLMEHAGSPGQARHHYTDAEKILVSLASPQVAKVRESLSRLDAATDP